MKAPVFLALLLITLLGNAQIKELSFDQIDSLKTNEKNIVVFIHTDWCKYCSKMRNTTLKNREIISLLNNKFIYIPFDAESKENISFRGYTFKFIPNGVDVGYHELAKALGTIEGQLNFPTVCILNSNYEIIFQHSGFINSSNFKKILNYSLN